MSNMSQISIYPELCYLYQLCKFAWEFFIVIADLLRRRSAANKSWQQTEVSAKAKVTTTKWEILWTSWASGFDICVLHFVLFNICHKLRICRAGVRPLTRATRMVLAAWDQHGGWWPAISSSHHLAGQWNQWWWHIIYNSSRRSNFSKEQILGHGIRPSLRMSFDMKNVSQPLNNHVIFVFDVY